MSLLDAAYAPAVEVPPGTTVRDAVSVLLPNRGDALVVKKDRECAGILTSSDIIQKVVLAQLNPRKILVQDVMTSPVVMLHPRTPPQDAINLMLGRKFRHVPLSEDGITVCGMLSLWRLLLMVVEDQRDDLDHLAAFISVDSPGG